MMFVSGVGPSARERDRAVDTERNAREQAVNCGPKETRP